MKQIQVGGWRFDPASGELMRNGTCRRLEPRAARALEILCASPGQVISHQRLIDEVWSGRSLSDNSVAVVIGQLRRALEADRGLIETVPKRGYRLADGAASAMGPGARLKLGLAIALLLAIAGVILWLMRAPGLPTVAMADVANDTGDARLSPHARATSELLVNDLRHQGFTVRRDDGPAELVLRPRLVTWNGKPWLGLTATDRQGAVRWSAMLPGAPSEVPSEAKGAIADFKQEFSSP